MTGCHTNTATAPLSACHEVPEKMLPIQADLSWSPLTQSHFALLLFLFSSQVIISCSHFALFVWTVTEAPGPYITIPQYQFNKTKLFAHCAFDVALSPPRFPANWLPFAFFLIRLLSCFGFSLLAAIWEDFFSIDFKRALLFVFFPRPAPNHPIRGFDICTKEMYNPGLPAFFFAQPPSPRWKAKKERRNLFEVHVNFRHDSVGRCCCYWCLTLFKYNSYLSVKASLD